MENTLTLDAISKLLADTRKRGVYEPRIQGFVDSGELAINFSELPEFKGMDAQSIRNSVRLNLDKKSKDNDWPTLQVVVDRTDKNNHQVILINMDVLAASQAGE